MSTQVLRPMFVDYFSLFAPYCDAVIVDDGCLSTVGIDGSECSGGENTVPSERGNASGTESCNLFTLQSRSSGDKSVTWSDFVFRMNSAGSIECERMSSVVGNAEVSVCIS